MKQFFVILVGLLFAASVCAQNEVALEKSDSLFAKGVELYKAKKFREAIPVFSESDRIDKAELDSTSNRRNYSAMWLASCHYRLGDSLTARTIDSNNYRFAPVDRRLTVRSDSLSAIGAQYYQNGDYEKALNYLSACADIEKNVVGNDHIWYGNTLYYLATCNSLLGNYAEAIRLGTEALNIQEKLLGTEHPDYALSLSNLAYYNYSLGNYVEAIRLGTEALNICKKTLGTEHPDYATSLNNLADYNSSLGNYSEAIRLGTEALNIQEKLLGTEHPNYAMSLEYLASYNSSLGNYSEAIRLGTEALNIQEKLLGTEHPDYAMSLEYLAYYNASLGNYSEAIRLETKALNIRKKALGTEHPDYATSLNNLASNNAFLGNYDEAIRLGTEALNIYEKLLGIEHPDYATSLSNLAIYHSSLGNYSEAIRLETKALNIRKKALGTEHPDYATSLNNLASNNAFLGNYDEAIRLGTEALNIYEKLLGIEHPDYATSLSNLADYNSSLGNYSEAIRLGTKALNIRKKALGTEHPDYATSLNNLASNNAFLGNYAEAIRLGTEALNICKKTLGTEHPNYAMSLNNLGNYNASLGNYSEAIRLGTEALNIRKKTLGSEHPDYAMFLNNLASNNAFLGNYDEAIRLGTEALNIYEKLLGIEHPDYATSLSNLAIYHSSLGNYSEAIRLGTKALNIRKKALGTEHPDYATSLNNLASNNAFLGNYDEAIRLGTEALNIYEKLLGIEHPDYATSLSNLADYNSSLGNYSEAIRLGTKALNIRKKALGTEHPDYATSLNNLASNNAFLGNYDEAIRLGTEALNIYEKLLGTEHPSYVLSLGNLAYYNFLKQDLSNLTRYADQATNSNVRIILKTFTDLTSSERNLYWQQQADWFVGTIHRFAYKFPQDSLISNAYRCALLSKGLLLNSEIEMNKLLLESGDEAVVEAYKELQTNRRILNKLYEKPIAERYMNTDSLETVVNTMERELVQRSKTYGDYTRNLAIDWKDVQQKLGEKDVAVEFVSFPYENDSTVYAAYVLKSDMTTPQMVRLFEAKQLSAVPKSDYYTTSDLSKLVWQNLDDYISDAKNIYFAPAGELYNIAIESVPDYQTDGLMTDHWNLYRLSSTRELAVIKDNGDIRNATLYGGLKYNAGVQVLADDIEKYPNVRSRDLEFFNLADSLDLRSGAQDLPGTKIEVENIDLSLKKTRILPHLLTGINGTEASFKDLSGKKVNMLHIATHGFYWSETEARQRNNLDFLMLGDNNTPRYVEDKALTRSGLLLSGANNALRGIPIPENAEDGILTAKEISALDLRDLDLVVLSACQTGLGEITGDGVFGLQRGFKKAGANTLMMSLWKVDDNATQLLMSKFYENLIAGKSKYESLCDAQRYVREFEQKVEVNNSASNHRPITAHEREQAQKNEIKDKQYKIVKPFQAPKYWAAFILLDGLNQ